MKDDPFVDYVLDQLQRLDGVTSRPMFGGHGLYRGEAFFGIIHNAQLFLRTDDSTRPEYERRGSGPFRPNSRQTLKSYYEVPADVIDDSSDLYEWSLRAIAAQERSR